MRVSMSIFFALGAIIASTGFPANSSLVNRHKPEEICAMASEIAAKEFDVPLVLLQAVTMAETGRTLHGQFSAWPWTANVAGKGYWFDDKSAAVSFIATQIEDGAVSIDVGCFQINSKWHGHRFSSVDQMIQPIENARYAAQFLKDLYSETGNWISAAGKYHSRTHKHSARYTARLSQIITTMRNARIGDNSAVIKQVRRNTYPLLQKSQTKKTPGSLFSGTDKRRPSLINNHRDDS